MPLYESTFIARHDMSAQQVEALTEALTNGISEAGGKIAKTEFWGLKNLAYRIKKNRKGHYVHLNVDAPSEMVLEFERNLRINEDVLRFLTVRVDEFDSGPSPMMQVRAARDDRSRRGGGPRGQSDDGERGERGETRDSKGDSSDAPETKASDKASDAGDKS